MLSEAELKRFVGKFELKQPPLDLDIEFVGGKLRAVLGGQRSFGLIPVKADRFKVEKPAEASAAPDAYLQFERTGDAVTGLTLEQDILKLQFVPRK